VFSGPAASDQEATRARADRGDAEAQFSLGLQYANGKDVPQDYRHAAQWYLKAAEQSHALAQFNLATMYAAGQGVPRDDAQAMIWFQKAAAQGDAGAQYHLGMRHHRASIGGSTEEAIESRVEAFKWFQLAAAQGYRGSATACERVTQYMTRADVTNGNDRVAKFIAEKTNACEPR
jgi:TPR repeat protein